MAIVKEETQSSVEALGNVEYLDEQGTQELITQLKTYASEELTTPSP